MSNEHLLPPLSESSIALLTLNTVMTGRPTSDNHAVITEWNNRIKSAVETAIEAGASRYDVLNIEFYHLTPIERQMAFESEREEGFVNMTKVEVERLIQNHNLK